MCTLLVWKNQRPGDPLVIAANRDEFEGRPSTGPQRLSEHPLVVGGRDETAGGTWLAISEHGIVVALTNRRRAGKHDPARRSRGQLVLALAQRPSIREIRAELARIDSQTYNPFVLVALAADDGVYAQAGSDGLATGPVGDGVHAITNWEFDSCDHPKGRRAFELASKFDVTEGTQDELAARLHVLLSDHLGSDRGFDGGLCVHRRADRYGTRSSAIVMLGGARWRYWYVDGHPCENPLVDVTALLAREDTARISVEP